MNIILTAYFWGFIFILFGLSFILRIFFKIKLPLVKLTLAFILLIIGFKLVTNSIPALKSDNFAFFEKNNFYDSNFYDKYLVFFSKSSLNLQNIGYNQNLSTILIINFGSNLKLNYDKNYPTKIKIINVLSHSETNREDLNTFGKTMLKTSTYDERQKHLTIKIITVFGNSYIWRAK